MFTVKVKNCLGAVLDFSESDAYTITKIDGLSPSGAALNFSTMANFDGSQYNSGRLNSRNIVLYIKIHSPAEKNRLKLYNYFHGNKKIRIYYKNDSLDVFIDGYVETSEFDIFSMNETAQISIVCPDPYWKETTTTEITFSNVVSMFEFPFSIAESGIPFSELVNKAVAIVDNVQVQKGFIIEFRAQTDQILNPRIINRTTQKYFGVNFDMNQGDVIRINTQRGEKSVTLIRDGSEVNILNNMQNGSSWLQLVMGMNEIAYECDVGAENLNVFLSIQKYHEGV